MSYSFYVERDEYWCALCGAHPRHVVKVIEARKLKRLHCLACGYTFYPERFPFLNLYQWHFAHVPIDTPTIIEWPHFTKKASEK